jgi:hypothetical protein
MTRAIDPTLSGPAGSTNTMRIASSMGLDIGAFKLQLRHKSQ